MHSCQLQGETAQLGNTKQRHTYMISVAQLQQHSSCSSTAATERLDGRGVASDHTKEMKMKVDRSDASLKQTTARCTLTTTI